MEVLDYIYPRRAHTIGFDYPSPTSKLKSPFDALTYKNKVISMDPRLQLNKTCETAPNNHISLFSSPLLPFSPTFSQPSPSLLHLPRITHSSSISFLCVAPCHVKVELFPPFMTPQSSRERWTPPIKPIMVHKATPRAESVDKQRESFIHSVTFPLKAVSFFSSPLCVHQQRDCPGYQLQ
ncbi:hypothetical protein RRG08_020675 [Elysia crispata]|uniref:Uncharacterized protein n=1 Tax=Elysia crispata TaxID=231223 RepID=A0AAE0Z5T3_9GAST|nr:hypothetical protein RRG08_020675 [Elysia crispata]